MALLDNNAKVYERVWYTPYGQARHHRGQDITGDRAFDAADVNALLTKIGGGDVPITDTANYEVEYDLNRDGVISFADLPTGSAQAAVPLGQVSDLAATSGPDNWIGYAGYVWEGASSLYHVRFRSYSPSLGRWMQRDPLGTMTHLVPATAISRADPMSVNFVHLLGISADIVNNRRDAVPIPRAQYADGSSLYEYAKSSPLVWIDPMGLRVQLCMRSTNFQGTIGTSANCAAWVAGASHWWIKTDAHKRGLGTYGGGVPGQPGDQGGEGGAASPYKTQTGWNDHTGQSAQPGAHCVTIAGCNEDCINKAICDSSKQGAWKAFINDCNTKVRDVFKDCGCSNACLRWVTIHHSPHRNLPRYWGGLNNGSSVNPNRAGTTERKCVEYLFSKG